jgi:hypothetical protein
MPYALCLLPALLPSARRAVREEEREEERRSGISIGVFKRIKEYLVT